MYDGSMAFKRNWQTAQKQATNALKRYWDTPEDQADTRERLMMMAQSFVADALKLDKRKPPSN